MEIKEFVTIINNWTRTFLGLREHGRKGNEKKKFYKVHYIIVTHNLMFNYIFSKLTTWTSEKYDFFFLSDVVNYRYLLVNTFLKLTFSVLKIYIRIEKNECKI